MHILFLTDNYPPEVNAPATRTYEHCQEWIKKGHQVTVITCAPNFPYGKIYKGYKNKFYQYNDDNGIKVIRVWSYMAANSGVVRRVIDFLSFAFMSFFVGIFQKHDIIIATSPQFFTAWAGWAISKIRRKPWIFELRDLWPETIKTVNILKHGRAFKILEKIELGLYKDCTKVVSVTEAFKDNLISRGIASNHIEVITNGANLDLFYPIKKNKDLLKELLLEEKFIVGYIGTHGMSQGLDFILRCIKKIKDKSVHFLFIGDGAEKRNIVELAKKLNLSNITFLNSITKNNVVNYLSICDVSLVPLRKNDNFKSVLPSKIFEACAMKKPILLGVEGQAKKIIEKYGAGVFFDPENEVSFIKALEAFKDARVYRSCQKGCIKLAYDFDRKKLANNMINICEAIK